MTRFTFVDDDCFIDREITVEAATQQEAHALSWAQLTDEEKDACGCWYCIDEVPA